MMTVLKGAFMHSSTALQRHKYSFERQGYESGTTAGLMKRDSAILAEGILPVFYPQGGMFFLEGQPATGVFLLRTGRVKESVTSSRGKTAIVRVVGSGVILGLAPVLTGVPYDSTAETLEPTHADFVAKSRFLHALKTSGHLAQAVASQLSCNCRETYAAIRCLGISESVSERLARLILQWAECPLPNRNRETAEPRIRVTLTQEEIGQYVGSTRETTSRVLRDFREKKWINMNGCIWTIINADAIRRLAGV
jgi:CRP/FNR family transcriptional regulator, cyclic AMP receptor protein